MVLDGYNVIQFLTIEDTAFARKVDFNLPQRFDITYVDSNTEERRPIMIHRAVLGSFERFFGVLIEHYAGDFPLWLSPTQARVLPVTDAQTSEILEPEVVLQRKECSRSREERSRRGVLRNVSEECREMRVRGMRRMTSSSGKRIKTLGSKRKDKEPDRSYSNKFLSRKHERHFNVVQDRRLLMERNAGLIPDFAPQFGEQLENRN
ncbi:uncharacterized protein LOC128193743 [Vigna angularis]|uniref:uncharacterized protein LOC128193743 n=1 Tax=Phaseolus angularis TaxID=3914 RepID=UPI0022B45EC4|nr:uncharacterized protein LOC128193743 [Vigna angularis]